MAAHAQTEAGAGFQKPAPERPHGGAPHPGMGSCVHGILQARTLEWAAISFSNA